MGYDSTAFLGLPEHYQMRKVHTQSNAFIERLQRYPARRLTCATCTSRECSLASNEVT